MYNVEAGKLARAKAELRRIYDKKVSSLSSKLQPETCSSHKVRACSPESCNFSRIFSKKIQISLFKLIITQKRPDQSLVHKNVECAPGFWRI